MNPLRARGAPVLAALLVSAAGCAPALNWREVTPEGSGAVAMFPCKPSHEVRQVPLAGAPVRLAITACQAEGVMFALTDGDVGDPTRVGEVLDALRAAAVGNLSGAVTSEHRLQVEGMTPHPRSLALEVRGKMPDGREVHERLAFFSKGTRVYQATMFGPALDAEATETFFGGLRLP